MAPLLRVIPVIALYLAQVAAGDACGKITSVTGGNAKWGSVSLVEGERTHPKDDSVPDFLRLRSVPSVLIGGQHIGTEDVPEGANWSWAVEYRPPVEVFVWVRPSSEAGLSEALRGQGWRQETAPGLRTADKDEELWLFSQSLTAGTQVIVPGLRGPLDAGLVSVCAEPADDQDLGDLDLWWHSGDEPEEAATHLPVAVVGKEPEAGGAAARRLAPGWRDVSTQKVYWTDYSDHKIWLGDVDGTAAEVLLSFDDGIDSPRAIALDEAHCNMYWSQKGKIMTAKLDGTMAQVLIDTTAAANGARDAAGIELDLTNSKLYWMTYLGGGVFRADFDGTNVETVLTDNFDRQGMALSKTNKLLFFEMSYANIKVYNTDTQSEQGWYYYNYYPAEGQGYPVPDDVFFNPSSMAVDKRTDTVYFGDSGLDTIQKCAVKCKTDSLLSTVVSSVASPSGLAIDVDYDKLFWTDAGTSTILRANLDGSDAETLFQSGAQDLVIMRASLTNTAFCWTSTTTTVTTTTMTDTSTTVTETTLTTETSTTITTTTTSITTTSTTFTATATTITVTTTTTTDTTTTTTFTTTTTTTTVSTTTTTSITTTSTTFTTTTTTTTVSTTTTSTTTTTTTNTTTTTTHTTTITTTTNTTTTYSTTTTTDSTTTTSATTTTTSTSSTTTSTTTTNTTTTGTTTTASATTTTTTNTTTTTTTTTTDTSTTSSTTASTTITSTNSTTTSSTTSATTSTNSTTTSSTTTTSTTTTTTTDTTTTVTTTTVTSTTQTDTSTTLTTTTTSSTTTTTTTSITTTTTTTTFEGGTTATTFSVSMAVASASDFNEQSYINAVASAAGVDANEVTVNVSFEVDVTYSFSATMTEADAKAAIAAAMDVSVDDVTASTAGARRLGLVEEGAGEPRRLAVSIAAVITAADASKATAVGNSAQDPAGVVSALASKGITTTATQTSPSTKVNVVTMVKPAANGAARVVVSGQSLADAVVNLGPSLGLVIVVRSVSTSVEEPTTVRLAASFHFAVSDLANVQEGQVVNASRKLMAELANISDLTMVAIIAQPPVSGISDWQIYASFVLSPYKAWVLLPEFAALQANSSLFAADLSEKLVEERINNPFNRLFSTSFQLTFLSAMNYVISDSTSTSCGVRFCPAGMSPTNTSIPDLCSAMMCSQSQEVCCMGMPDQMDGDGKTQAANAVLQAIAMSALVPCIGILFCLAAKKVRGSAPQDKKTVGKEHAANQAVIVADKVPEGKYGDGEAGLYKVLYDVKAKKDLDIKSEHVGKLSEGKLVDVIEVTELKEEGRLRGRIREPAGWITLMDLHSGHVWAERKTLTLQDLRGEWRVFDNGQPVRGNVSIAETGYTLYDGSHWAGTDLFAAGRDVCRHDGWIVDMLQSSVDQISWAKEGETSASGEILWRRWQLRFGYSVSDIVEYVGSGSEAYIVPPNSRGPVVGFAESAVKVDFGMPLGIVEVPPAEVFNVEVGTAENPLSPRDGTEPTGAVIQEDEIRIDMIGDELDMIGDELDGAVPADREPTDHSRLSPDAAKLNQLRQALQKTTQSPGASRGASPKGASPRGFYEAQEFTPVVALTLKVQNVDYEKLKAFNDLYVRFKATVKQQIVVELGREVQHEHVHVELRPGSIICDITITPPKGDLHRHAMHAKLSQSPTLSNTTAIALAQLEGIHVISTGPLHVTCTMHDMMPSREPTGMRTLTPPVHRPWGGQLLTALTGGALGSIQRSAARPPRDAQVGPHKPKGLHTNPPEFIFNDEGSMPASPRGAGSITPGSPRSRGSRTPTGAMTPTRTGYVGHRPLVMPSSSARPSGGGFTGSGSTWPAYSQDAAPRGASMDSWEGMELEEVRVNIIGEEGLDMVVPSAPGRQHVDLDDLPSPGVSSGMASPRHRAQSGFTPMNRSGTATPVDGSGKKARRQILI